MAVYNRATEKRTRRTQAKRDAARGEHADKYADQRVSPDDRRMSELLADLAAHFNGEERDR